MKRRLLILGLLLFLPLDIWIGIRIYRHWYEKRHDEVIRLAASRYSVDPALVKAVMWHESRFNPRARGKVGEMGLMQVRELASQEWAEAEKLASFSFEQTADSLTNAYVGTWYLGKLLKRYRGTDHPEAYALADYNAGRTHVLRWNRGAASTNSGLFFSAIDFPGTRQYVRSVLERYRRYRWEFNEE